MSGGILVADDPAEFAKTLIQAHDQEPLWESLSTSALAWARSALSIDSGRLRLANILEAIGAPIGCVEEPKQSLAATGNGRHEQIRVGSVQ